MAEERKILSKTNAKYWSPRVYKPEVDGKAVSGFYIRIQHDGQRHALTLKALTREKAGVEARDLYLKIKANGWVDVLADYETPSGSKKLVVAQESTPKQKGFIERPTVGDLIRAAEDLLTVRRSTFESYAKAMRTIVSQIFGLHPQKKYSRGKEAQRWRDRVDKIPLDRIRRSDVLAWKNKRLREHENDPVRKKATINTVNTAMRGAKALYGKKIRIFLEERMKLPNPMPFDGDPLTDGADMIDFGAVEPGGTVIRTIRIRNTGNTALTGLAADFTGSGASDFSPVSMPSTVAAGGFADVDFSFSPEDLGERNVILRIASNDRDENPFDIAVKGIGGVPEIVVERDAQDLAAGSSTLDFDRLFTRGPGTAAIQLVIRNTGTAPLEELAAGIDGASAAEFSISAFSETSLPPGSSASVTVSFTPAATGVKSAALHLSSNDPDESPFDIILAGEFLERTSADDWADDFPELESEPQPLDFLRSYDNDLVSLLEEYAYNLDPTVADHHLVTPGSGTSGLPNIRIVDGRLRIEFLRRRGDPDLGYFPEFGSSPRDEDMSAPTEPEQVTPINSQWERVVVEDSAVISGGGSRASAASGSSGRFPRRLLKNSETKTRGCIWDGKSGFAGLVFDRPCRAATLLPAGFVAIQSGSSLPSITAPRQRPK